MSWVGDNEHIGWRFWPQELSSLLRSSLISYMVSDKITLKVVTKFMFSNKTSIPPFPRPPCFFHIPPLPVASPQVISKIYRFIIMSFVAFDMHHSAISLVPPAGRGSLERAAAHSSTTVLLNKSDLAIRVRAHTHLIGGFCRYVTKSSISRSPHPTPEHRHGSKTRGGVH